VVGLFPSDGLVKFVEKIVFHPSV